MKFTLLFKIMLMLLLAFPMTGYGQSNIMKDNYGMSNPKSNCDVYVSGSTRNAQGILIPTLWKNGVAQYLPQATPHATGFSVFVSGDDIYVAGAEIVDAQQINAILWINGVRHNLSETTREAIAYSVYVSDNDIYVAGHQDLVPTLWKNGIAKKLSDKSDSFARSVYVSGTDVYAAGYEWNEQNNKTYAIVWKNGERQQVDEGGKYQVALSVYVSEEDTYAVGYDDDSAMLWKNGVGYSLPHTGDAAAIARSVYVSGNDVYVVGEDIRYGNGGYLYATAKLWVNGEAHKLTSGTYDAIARSVYIFDNDVYVAGHEATSTAYPWKNVAKLWKNGVAQNLTDGIHDAEALSVFVIGRYTVSVSANPEEGGEVTGSGIYNEGASVVVCATSYTGYNFVNWTKGNVIVSTDSQYTFTATEDIELVAHFEVENNITSIIIDNVVLYPNPFTNEINVSNPEMIKSIQITNFTGQEVKHVIFNGKSIVTENLSSGIYFVIVESFIGNKAVYKMIRE